MDKHLTADDLLIPGGAPPARPGPPLEPRSSVTLNLYLDRLEAEGSLLPGGADALRKWLAARGKDRNLSQALAEVDARLNSETGRHLRSPDAPAEPSALKRVLGRLPVTEQAREALYRKFAVPLANQPEGSIAAELFAFLDRRENYSYLVERPPYDIFESRALEVLMYFREVFAPGIDPADLLPRFGSFGRDPSFRRAVERFARLLQSPGIARELCLYGGPPKVDWRVLASLPDSWKVGESPQMRRDAEWVAGPAGFTGAAPREAESAESVARRTAAGMI